MSKTKEPTKEELAKATAATIAAMQRRWLESLRPDPDEADLPSAPDNVDAQSDAG